MKEQKFQFNNGKGEHFDYQQNYSLKIKQLSENSKSTNDRAKNFNLSNDRAENFNVSNARAENLN